jgi:hypothetical protein
MPCPSDRPKESAMSRLTSALLGALVLLSSMAAHAVDGVTLIDQAVVAASGGFPYEIKQPGSYRLSGNLVVSANVNSLADGIHILADAVTLDLNGFSISPASGATANSAVTDVGLGRKGVAVRNGILHGWRTAVSLHDCTACTVQQMTVFDSLNGILVGRVGMVSSNVVEDASAPQGLTIGIEDGEGSTVFQNSVSGFSTDILTSCPSLILADTFFDGFGGGDICPLYQNLIM